MATRASNHSNIGELRIESQSFSHNMDLSMMKATDTSMGSASSATVDIKNKENSVSVSATIQRKIIGLNP